MIYTLKSSISRASLLIGTMSANTVCVAQQAMSDEEVAQFLLPLVSILYSVSEKEKSQSD